MFAARMPTPTDKSALFQISDRVAAALAARRPVVALETTVVTHGLPHPRGIEAAARNESLKVEQDCEIGGKPSGRKPVHFIDRLKSEPAPIPLKRHGRVGVAVREDQAA